MMKKVICIKNTIEIENDVIVSDMVEIGKIYDMERIIYGDDNSFDLYDCLIYDNDNIHIWRLPLNFFEPLDEYRNRIIDNILNE